MARFGLGIVAGGGATASKTVPEFTGTHTDTRAPGKKVQRYTAEQWFLQSGNRKKDNGQPGKKREKQERKVGKFYTTEKNGNEKLAGISSPAHGRTGSHQAMRKIPVDTIKSTSEITSQLVRM